jgi:branched-chain amino acid transport system substrate-binding protein
MKRYSLSSLLHTHTVSWVFALAALSFAGLTGSANCEPLKVGILVPQEGKLAACGNIEKNAFRLAAKKVNATGGVRGSKLELIFRNSATKKTVIRSTVKTLVLEDGVLVLSGGCSSEIIHNAASEAQRLKVPFLINTAAADKITEMRWKYVFRINAPASEYIDTLATFLRKVASIRTAAVFFENGSGHYALRRFSRLCKRLGIRLIMRGAYGIGASDLELLVMKTAEKKPDLIYILSRVTDAAMIMRQVRRTNIETPLFVGGEEAIAKPEFEAQAQEYSDYVFALTRWNPRVPYPGAREFATAYRKEYGSYPDYHGAQAYAAMQVIVDAFKRARSFTHQDAREALLETNVKTVYGPVTFEAYGKKTQQNRIPTILAQWMNGKLHPVWPIGLATKKYVYPLPARDAKETIVSQPKFDISR